MSCCRSDYAKDSCKNYQNRDCNLFLLKYSGLKRIFNKRNCKETFWMPYYVVVLPGGVHFWLLMAVKIMWPRVVSTPQKSDSFIYSILIRMHCTQVVKAIWEVAHCHPGRFSSSSQCLVILTGTSAPVGMPEQRGLLPVGLHWRGLDQMVGDVDFRFVKESLWSLLIDSALPQPLRIVTCPANGTEA